jgi:hypothetical protein
MLTITARNMIEAQGYRLTGAARAELTARADRERARDGETCLEAEIVEVHDFDGALIGYLQYML